MHHWAYKIERFLILNSLLLITMKIFTLDMAGHFTQNPNVHVYTMGVRGVLLDEEIIT